ncbi:MAG: glycosyl transferase [Gammaproteobacteria bacterium RBG_16_51_14]|nr:MAG: glycosyl transferase [Gammaproteobacteria bacterium RBG_16_51_14]
MDLGLLAALSGLIIWLVILLLPWQPWSTHESLDADPQLQTDLADITALIPARNEEETIADTLHALSAQGPGLKIVLIDDQSSDHTIAVARSTGIGGLEIIAGTPLPPHWSGKLWALEQGRHHAGTGSFLLLDADISLRPGTVAALIHHLQSHDLQLVSLMAFLRMTDFWERLLIPAFIYFFKLLYPFRLSNSQKWPVAAAAGGCILIRTSALDNIGGFHAIREALIDDCSLAKKIKSRGGRTWIGLTHSAISTRSYNTLGAIWNMVARTAYTQLHHSLPLLGLCTFIMILAFILPLAGLCLGDGSIKMIALLSLLLMSVTYLPSLRYYSIPAYWCLYLPVSGLLFLLMTWTSAIQYYAGSGASWKGRNYHESH